MYLLHTRRFDRTDIIARIVSHNSVVLRFVGDFRRFVTNKCGCKRTIFVREIGCVDVNRIEVN
jgi:hypothetical protein